MPELPPVIFPDFQYNGQQDSHEINILLAQEHTALNELFPRSIRESEKVILHNGKRIHEFTLQIGGPKVAAEIFSGKSLEVGGGSSDYKKLKTVKGQVQPTLVTNVDLYEGVHELADAGRLHYADGTFNALLAMNLPGTRREGSDKPQHATLHDDFIREAYRVLVPGGWLLMSGADKEDLASALNQGFNLEAGNGCIVSWLAVAEGMNIHASDDAAPFMAMELLLHR